MAFAKTTRPTLATTVVRSRLFRRLDPSRKKQITWAWGPPGVGKTSLVASYLTTRKIQNLWYQVDEGDTDVATFFYFLGQAAPRRRRPLPLLTPEYRRGLAIFTRRFFREIYSRLKTPFVIVFDDYQEVPVDSSLHEVMREALAEIPKDGHVIFISRSEPPPAFAHLLKRDAIEILDAREIRFTYSETSGLIVKLAPARLPAKAIRSLYESSDGWAAGIVLLLDQFQRRPPGPQEPKRQSPDVLFDYFAGEIYEGVDPQTKEVLLLTAFLPARNGVDGAATYRILKCRPHSCRLAQAELFHQQIGRQRVGVRVPSVVSRIFTSTSPENLFSRSSW